MIAAGMFRCVKSMTDWIARIGSTLAPGAVPVMKRACPASPAGAVDPREATTDITSVPWPGFLRKPEEKRSEASVPPSTKLRWPVLRTTPASSTCVL